MVKKISSKKVPECLKKQIKLRKTKSMDFNKSVNVFNFLEFFIKERYFVKSSRCELCKFDNDCDGYSVNYIRKVGFNKLKPQK